MTGPQLADHLGVTYRQIDYWTRQGWIIPRIKHPGSGSPRSYPAKEVEIAEMIARLVNFGVTPEVAASTARAGASLGWSLGRVLTEGREAS